MSSAPTPEDPVDAVFSLFTRFGNSDYIGEPVSSEEHALQVGRSCPLTLHCTLQSVSPFLVQPFIFRVSTPPFLCPVRCVCFLHSSTQPPHSSCPILPSLIPFLHFSFSF